MLRAIYPGSFDPVTYGHLDIIRRSCKIVDELVVGVLNNNAKMPLFSVEERVKMLEEATKDLTNVRIVPFHGLLIDFARQMDAFVIIRGLRAIRDFEYELEVIRKYEPKLFKAVNHIFGESYEYTRKYREFCKQMKEKERINKL